MKVIFVKKVPKVGNIGEVKEQPDGYVRNFLLPKGFAIIATPEAVKKLEQKASELKVGKEIQAELFKKNIEAVRGAGVTIAVKANVQGSLFKGVSARDIAEALKKEHRISIDEDFIKLEGHIKQAGDYTIPVEAIGMKEKITVKVVAA